MRYRRFGKTDLEVSEVGFGCARIGGVFEGSSKVHLLRLLRQSFDAGVTFYDTADLYSQGGSERLLGEAFRTDRGRVVIATKVGYLIPAQKRLVSRIKPMLKPILTRMGLKRQRLPGGILGEVSAQDFSATYITKSVEGSLARLKTDYIDVYQLHSPPREVLERGDFVAPLERLKQQGKIRYWGVACERVDDALVCIGIPGLSSIQISLSLLHPDALEAAIPRAAATGIAVIARQVFASGLLTRPPSTAQIEELDQVARECGTTLPQHALSYVFAQSGVSVALLGMHRATHLAEALRYLELPAPRA
jgi:aryl-alcohol dehydrogenase-like predicted oxidoreductase